MPSVKNIKAAPDQLRADQQIILSKFKPVVGARELLKPGSYMTDFTARIIGQINVGEDSETSNSIDWKALALHLLKGQSPKGALKALKESISSPQDETLEGKLKELASPLLGKRPTAGKVTGMVTVLLTEAKR